jgi:hypothetical protein
MKYEDNDKPAKVVRAEIKKVEDIFELFMARFIPYGSADWCRYKELMHEYRMAIYNKEL